MDTIITAQQLKLLLHNKNLVLVDAGSGESAHQAYVQRHLQGAVYADLNLNLAHVPNNPANGGRHPLPNQEEFAVFLGSLGIHPNSHVVVYDDKQGSNAAARLWWMLRASGHTAVQVLSGGIQQAIALGIEVTNKIPQKIKLNPYPVAQWQLGIKNKDEVAKAILNNNYLVIDVRDSDRYNGITEPIDTVAGHIPGAINIPFKENLDESGNFLEPAKLHSKYAGMVAQYGVENIIVHCGSGVTACHTLLAFAQAKLGIPALYVGSWSEWSRNFNPQKNH